MNIIAYNFNGEKSKLTKSANLTLRRLWLAVPLAGLVISLLLRPAAGFAAAADGLGLWYRVVVPSLLPFFIISELLLALGAAERAGRFLSPLMRPLFSLPGAASLAVVLGFSSGFPTGGAVTAGLYRSGLLSREEAGRLLAFTNNAGPLYISVAVATGLLGCPAAGLLLAAVHYGLDLLLGVVLGLWSRRCGADMRPAQSRESEAGEAALPPFAVLLKAAAQRAAANIVLIGCYMVFFSVITAMLAPAALAGTRPLLFAAANGVWEMSLGMNALAGSGLPLRAVLPLAAAQLAFGGLSVQAQVLAMIADTDISPRYYLLSRPLHALASALLTAWLLPRVALPQPTAALPGLPAVPLLPLYLGLAAAAFLLWLAGCGLGMLLRRASR